MSKEVPIHIFQNLGNSHDIPPIKIGYTVEDETENNPPKKEYDEASGFDLRSMENVILKPGETKIAKTGLRIEIPFLEKSHFQLEGQIRSTSGNAAKRDIFVLNSPGTIDADYRGEIKCILHNAGKTMWTISKGDKIGQLVITPVFRNIEFVKETELSETSRGENGLGSTGTVAQEATVKVDESRLLAKSNTDPIYGSNDTPIPDPNNQDPNKVSVTRRTEI